MRAYWDERHRTAHGLRAVGRIDRTEEENRRDYEVARATLAGIVALDFPSRPPDGVLDVGFGHGHDARVMAELGVDRYCGIDFAAPRPEGFPSAFRFLTRDASEPGLDLGERFELVLLVDVAFHVIEDSDFEAVVDFVARHASHRVYVTGLFRDETIAAHVRHRDLRAFRGVGRPIDVRPWRDTLIARFEV